MKHNQKGFTLIELMIVVAIIGILAAIAIPKFADMLEKSRDGATKGNLTALNGAISIYFGDQQGIYPTDLTATNAGASWNFLAKYIETVPPVKSTALNSQNGANKGKGPGVGAGSKTITYLQLTDATSLNAAGTTGTGWRYASDTGTDAGKLWVNSSLLDMQAIPYSFYGFQ